VAPVVAAAVDIQATGDQLTAIGTLAAVQEVTLFAQVSGVVTEIDFKPGTQVTAGQTLVKLDSKDQEVARDRAKVALDDAKAALERGQKLAKSNNMTLADLQTAQVTERKAEIDLQAAELDLAKRTISAPFAGTIGLTDLSLGDYVTPQKAIATLDDMTTLTVAFQSPERFAAHLSVGNDLSAPAESLAGE
jgi:RND family efflux transporter MFP subunit